MNVIRVKAVASKLSVSVPTVWNWVRDGEFPAPFSISPSVTVWDEADVDAWLKAKKGEKDESN